MNTKQKKLPFRNNSNLVCVSLDIPDSGWIIRGSPEILRNNKQPVTMCVNIIAIDVISCDFETNRNPHFSHDLLSTMKYNKY